VDGAAVHGHCASNPSPVEWSSDAGSAFLPGEWKVVSGIAFCSEGCSPGVWKAERMDAVDRRLLAELQADARLSFNELSRRVNLSAPAVAERVRRLETAGVLTGYHAQVDLVRAGRPVGALVQVQCYGPRCVLRDPAVRDWPEVQQLHRVTGGACCVLLVAVESMAEFEALIDRLAEYGQPSSTMILSSPVQWRPVEPA
jgi:Lrp/AsnC family transcriptional regulator, leucine-responsive regulatory protein